MAPGESASRYIRPGWFTRHVFNRLVAGFTRAGFTRAGFTRAGFTRAGISVWGSRELRVRGRTSGQWRATPVNLLVHEGHRYLVAPRGQTQWVRNLRAAGEGELRAGRRVERFRAREVTDEDKPAILRAYLRRWKAEVGVFFQGVDAASHEEDLRRIAADYPVFLIEALTAKGG